MDCVLYLNHKGNAQKSRVANKLSSRETGWETYQAVSAKKCYGLCGKISFKANISSFKLIPPPALNGISGSKALPKAISSNGNSFVAPLQGSESSCYPPHQAPVAQQQNEGERHSTAPLPATHLTMQPASQTNIRLWQSHLDKSTHTRTCPHSYNMQVGF